MKKILKQLRRGTERLFLTFLMLSLTYVCLAQFAGGEGTEEDPWLIANITHLINVRDYLGPDNNNVYFRQISDISLDVEPHNEGAGWIPIGHVLLNQQGQIDQDHRFYGKYDGNGHTVDGLFFHRPAFDMTGQFTRQGLFGFTSGAVISNLGVIDVNVEDGGNWYVGSLVGQADNGTIIDNCYSTGIIGSSTASSGYYTGGLVSAIVRGTMVKNSYSTAAVSGRVVGGLVALGSTNNPSIINSYSLGSVSGLESVGGLIGNITATTVSNSYSRGNVSATNRYAGGLIGRIMDAASIVTNSYSTGRVTSPQDVGGLVGASHANTVVTNSYWDRETSLQNASVKGIGRDTAEMTFPYADNTFTNWDFEEIWTADQTHDINDGYPILWYQFSQEFAGGDGTEANPWQIATAEHLNNVRNYLGMEHNNKFFIQTANIDLTEATREGGEYWNDGEGWIAIGHLIEEDDLRFYGTYNGDNHTISGMFINRPEVNYNGLFGYIFGATISNLNVLEVDITGRSFISPIAARSIGDEENITTISNCHTSGSVTSTASYAAGMVGNIAHTTITHCSSSCTITASARSAGMVGQARYNNVISNSHTTGNVTGRQEAAECYIGGFIGFAWTTTVMTDCYNTGDVRAGGRWVGGFAARIQGGGTEAINCYNTGNVTATSGNAVGGFTGWTFRANLINCFNTGNFTATGTSSYVGGLVGEHRTASVIRNCYNTGDVIAANSSRVGGLVGFTHEENPTIINSYSAGSVRGRSSVGGLVGFLSGAPLAVNSYWDRETSGTTTSAGGTHKSTAEMTYRPDLFADYPHYDPNTYGNAWGISDERHNDDIWHADTEYAYNENPDNMRPGINNGYPILFFQIVPEDMLDVPEVTIEKTVIEDIPHIRISWEVIEDAQSYNIYSSTVIMGQDWGEPIATTGETFYQLAINQDEQARFYRVTASTREP